MFIMAGILLWLDEKCFNLILSRGGRHMFSNTNPEREEAGPWHRNQAGDYLEPDILQIIFFCEHKNKEVILFPKG